MTITIANREMDTTAFVSRFIIREQPLYAKVDWKDNETDLFHIQLFDGEHSWLGRFSREFAEKYRELVVESEEQYSKNVMEGLTQQSEMFTYDFSPDPFNPSDATFSWKKQFEGGVTLVHGSVPIHKQSEPAHRESLIDTLLAQNRDLKQSLENYESQIQILSSELEQSKSDTEKFMNAKVELESSIYGKFISLLNSKKRRIELLEQHLHAPSHGDNDVD